MEKKQVIGSLLTFVLTLLMLAATIFAWFTLSEQSNVDEFVVDVTEFDADILLKVKKNNGEYVTIITKQDMDNMFFNAIPSDIYHFMLTITNKSTINADCEVILNDITSLTVEEIEGFDMRDCFYLVDGKIFVNEVASVVDVISEDETIINGKIVNLYRLNNILINNDLKILKNQVLGVDEVLTIEFSICYDQETEHINYQKGIINIDSIQVFLY